MTEIKTADMLTKRAATAADEPWMRQLFAQLRGLDPAMIAACPALLEQQWQLQQRVFASHYPEAHTELVLLDDAPIGLITLHEGASTIRVLEIGLEARYRGRGYGQWLLGDLTRHADRQGKALELAVMGHNPAIRLYQRLGFRALPANADEVQLQMRREPVQRD
ncbi:GNAT family N-acetyltransferase [Pseudomonas resinovorans]|uniref:GNAT family N-acetyltransferase n=1 Tax=Metapseudomonas resinovorans TaxID=53412 RepID=A0ABT4Y1R4_METRE|nr:GNAT family N-acetyltransferase [Pseudomonas resinovorans]MDA8482774.1 GNAT family N-acetyltransferase [Pseudomonas resinovorans]